MSHTIGQIKQDNHQLGNSSQIDRNSSKPEKQSRSPMSISDTDYEFLFNQLLEGIAHGWQGPKIVKFFIRLSDRAEQSDWVAWLERLKDKASVLPLQSKQQLGTMMIRLGELTRSTAEANQIGVVSYRIGRELLFDHVESVWEYVGPDLPPEGKIELTERLVEDSPEFSSDGVVEETVEAAETELNSHSVEEKISESTMFWEYVGPDLAAEKKLELTEKLAKDSPEFSSDGADEDTAEADLRSTNEAAETELNSDLVAEKISKSTILDELTADLVDFPESILPAEETTSDTVLSSEPELSLSSTNPGLIAKTKLDSDNGQDIARSMSTGSELESFNISQVMNLIQEDEELARQISQKLTRAVAPTQKTVALDCSSLELIESWFNLGLKQVSVGEFSKAIASWEKALKIDPNLSEAWHNRGSALGRLGDYQAAIESFQNALAIDPDNYQAWNDRAHALYQLQNWSQAADSWSNAIKIMPGNHLFWYNRGCALEQLQRWDEAIASHEKALEIMPDFKPGRLRYINLIADNSRSN